ncbi:MAG: cell division protein FtsZ [Candidatus Woesearchaeota archaeon]
MINSAQLKLDEQLKEQVYKTRLKIVGIGGAGNNTLDTIAELGIEGVETIAVNTDAQDLLNTVADKKILIGKELSRGLGAGNDPEQGKKAALENISDVLKAVEGCDAVFLTCGLGGGTGGGAIGVIAEACKKAGCLTIAVVSLPFTVEGKRRIMNANKGLLELTRHADSIILVPNDRLLETAPNLPLVKAFKLVDSIVANALKGIIELVTKPGLVNLDFADLRTVMRDSGIGLIGIGESDAKSRAEEAVMRAITNPLLDIDLSKAKGALVNIVGGNDFRLEEAHCIVNSIASRLDRSAKIIWGAKLEEGLKGKIRVFVVLTGLRSTSFTDAHAQDGFVWLEDLK